MESKRINKARTVIPGCYLKGQVSGKVLCPYSLVPVFPMTKMPRIKMAPWWAQTATRWLLKWQSSDNKKVLNRSIYQKEHYLSWTGTSGTHPGSNWGHVSKCNQIMYQPVVIERQSSFALWVNYNNFYHLDQWYLDAVITHCMCRSIFAMCLFTAHFQAGKLLWKVQMACPTENKSM